MRVPLSQIVKPRIVRSCACKEFVKLCLMLRGVPNEMGSRTAGALDGDVYDAKGFIAHMFAEQQSADLATARAAQFTLKASNYWLSQKKLHLKDF